MSLRGVLRRVRGRREEEGGRREGGKEGGKEEGKEGPKELKLSLDFQKGGKERPEEKGRKQGDKKKKTSPKFRGTSEGVSPLFHLWGFFCLLDPGAGSLETIFGDPEGFPLRAPGGPGLLLLERTMPERLPEGEEEGEAAAAARSASSCSFSRRRRSFSFSSFSFSARDAARPPEATSCCPFLVS
jgi:hypothetical protein